MPVVEPKTEVSDRAPHPTTAGGRCTTQGDGAGPCPLVVVKELASREGGSLAGTRNDVLLARSWLVDRCGVPTGDITVLTQSQGHEEASDPGGCVGEHTSRRMEEGRVSCSSISAGETRRSPAINPNEADGLEETLVAYDSVPGDRATLLTLSRMLV